MKDPNIGRILQGRYQLARLLGQGSMGRVYGADDITLGGVPVAIKFLSQTLLNGKMRSRFEREAKTCAQLGQRSIHIVRVTDYGIDEEGIPFYVMEYLRGDNLSSLISRQPLSIPRFLHLCRQICLGLQCAHEGIHIDGELYPIVHRDIKPSNILVSQNDSFGELTKILDFGIAKVMQAEASQTNCFMGTLAYSSPEQMEGRELDARSDIYSLGVMMFQMLTGRMPLHANTHSFGGWYKAHHFQPPQSFETANPSIKLSRTLERLVMSCLAKSPTDRPQTVAEILTTLAPLEERYGTGRQIARRIGASLSRLTTPPYLKESNTLSANDACRFATWPANMPIAEIVFSRAIACHEGIIPTLWVMLPLVEIQKRTKCTRYNQFLFLELPHPMTLWLTVLYNEQHGPRWLPCYLDLKTAQGQQMVQLLGQHQHYRLLFFAQENPKHCYLIQISTIAAAQCKLLQQWAAIGQRFSATPNPSLSKDYLKGALEDIKPQILLKLESLYDRQGDDPPSQLF
ncbi:serine/threonine protein kinase [Thermocoleostomius sinensis]|uniref:Serine/threonine-protein kinase n=1 Tax=Thermocoleostomius sinensis A174 TaxID=2016057 RepID=A0A9E9CBT1_9CYAN|nr:serine/threonine-protein kinase [Thermocoleostomius sinensis]WAL62912.1 serine/threonine-protein kinase [Thermocoleostomius sinensis A174]